MSDVNKGAAKDRTIARIKAGILVTRLQAFALADKNSDEYKKVAMTPTQVQAARILLAKTLPDQKAVEQTIKDERAKTKTEIFARLNSLGLDPEEIWQSVSKH